MTPFETVLTACAVTFVAIRVLEYLHWMIFASAGFRIRSSTEAALVEVENTRTAERAHRAEANALTTLAEEAERRMLREERDRRWANAERARKTEEPAPPQDC